ncbi:hypothetical protein BST61_g9177 [Cercospora zeina]
MTKESWDNELEWLFLCNEIIADYALYSFQSMRGVGHPSSRRHGSLRNPTLSKSVGVRQWSRLAIRNARICKLSYALFSNANGDQRPLAASHKPLAIVKYYWYATKAQPGLPAIQVETWLKHECMRVLLWKCFVSRTQHPENIHT